MLAAGRELDVLLAEKIMGWTVHHAKEGGWGAPPANVRLGAISEYIPAYSTDIAAAWEAVEKIGRRVASKRCVVDFILEWDHSENCWCAGWAYYSYDGPQYEFAGKAETAPLAICLAALDAVGYEPKETA